MEYNCGLKINILAHKMKKCLNATLADIGITGVQSQIMHFIIQRCKTELVFQRDVEEAFGLSRSTATGILQLMEKNDLIRRERVEHDGRLKSLVPTQKAIRINAQVRAGMQQWETVMMKDLPSSQIQLFLETAEIMSANLDDIASTLEPH